MALAARGRLGLLTLALALAPPSLAGAATAPEIRFAADGERTVVELRGVDPEQLGPPWASWFVVYTEEASQAEGALPPLLGSYELESWGIRFRPRFQLAAGLTYVARFRDSAAGETIETRHSVPAVDDPPSTTLTGVYPSVPQVPENLLRLYLRFSAPMSRGRARDHIRLLGPDGKPVEGPFVAPERELWSPDGTRLTLFFDPGRIKRGVGPNREVGPPLEAGSRYRLEVDHELADARGVPLVRDYYKEFTVGAPDRDQPRTEDWRLDPPSGRHEPVRLTFPEPLDHGLLEGLLQVLDASGQAVAGSVSLARGESSWSFLPEAGWGRGAYRIRVGTLLEDLAGNSLRRPFEAALNGSGGATEPFVDLPFSVQ